MKVIFTESQISEVYQKMNAEKSVSMYKRYQSVYLRMTGRTIEEVSTIVGKSTVTVVDYFKRFKAGGINALTPRKAKGQPKKLTDEQEQDLKNTILSKSPQDVGFESKINWTADIVVKFIEREYGKTYTTKGVTFLFNRIGLKK